MTSRQEATDNAIQWAQEAETRFNAAEYAEHYDQAEDARRMADTWTRIARLLPSVLPAQQLEAEPCGHERPTLGSLIPPAHCTLPTGHRPPHRDATGTSWNVAQQCPSHHAFDDYEEHCERQAGHHGIHTARGLQWGPNDPAATNPTQTNETPTTSPERHPDCFIEPCRHPHCGDTCPWRRRPDSPIVVGTAAKLPSPRAAGDDQTPRCQSRRDGEQCERADGHSGIHQGATCGWRNSSSATEPVTPTVPEAARCCRLTVAHIAEQLERHARTAAGLSGIERRCLEDAADFVRAHMPAATLPEAWCAAKTPHGPHTCAWGDGPFRCPGFPGGQP